MTAVNNDLLDDLKWRGLIAQTTDEAVLSEALKKPITLYLGTDPTAPSIHVGNLVPLLVMRRFQLAGHNPILLVGGATGLVGDPSGRNDERSLNDADVVANWVNRIKAQLSKFMVNKDSVSSRLEKDGISYTEFSYQVLQSMDYLELYRRSNCTLQIGGSDQWGNITAGLDLIRRAEGGSAHALTVPLLTKADGTKFGKTAGGSVWLDPEMTSPYAFFQYWLNSDDADVIKFITTFSFKTRDEIEALEARHNENPGAREAHRELARELTSLVHSPEIAQRVEVAARALFGQADLAELDEATLASAIAELPRTTVSIHEEIPTWVDLLAATGVVDSKSAARRIVKESGAYLNNEKVPSEDFRLEKSHFLCGKYALLRKGKRDLAAVELIS